MASASVIDDFVTTLARTLRGPLRVRRDMIAEARDSLTDTADAYLAEGMDRDEAERLAVAEFGMVTEIAPGYQDELAACQGRRTAAVLFVSVPLSTVIWSVIWRIYPQNPWTPVKPVWFSPLAQFLDWFQFGMGVLGALALLTLARGPLRHRNPKIVTRALGVLLWIQVPLVIGMSAALTLGRGTGLRDADLFPAGLFACLFSYAVAGSLLFSATRCLLVSRRATPPRGREAVS
ncbi:permease prefix domain 1-containing protein [Sphaerisporangium sp. NPDC051011]|uniref:permease prefix domain 1-containing protein n=1 Tax=Sphaerisporangium sp. NPDC051011 TaxID=3155792 RepID=UPI00340DE2AE